MIYGKETLIILFFVGLNFHSQVVADIIQNLCRHWICCVNIETENRHD